MREREKLFSHFRKIGEIGGNLTISIRKRKMKNEQSAIPICMKIMASLDLGDQPLIISLLLHVHAPPSCPPDLKLTSLNPPSVMMNQG